MIRLVSGEFHRNDTINVKIVDLTHTGEGVGKVDGFTVFVENCVPGDEVQVRLTTIKKNYAIGELMKFYQRSSIRQEAPCTFFGECGGCQIQNIQYAEQLKWKQTYVMDALKRLGQIEDAEELMRNIIGMDEPFNYRNKAQYKISSRGKVGFYKKKSHHVVPLTKCIIQQDPGQELLESMEHFIEEEGISIYDEASGKGLLRGVVQRVSKANGNSMVILVWNGTDLTFAEKMGKNLAEENPSVSSVYVNVNLGKNNRIMGYENQLIYGDEKLVDAIGTVQFKISPASFFQVNNSMTEVIYETVDRLLNLRGEEVVFDLYCGMGTIGLYLAKKAKMVYGIESIHDAVLDARENASFNQITNAEFISGKAEAAIFELKDRQIEPDCVILDPPRKGCEEKLLHAVIDSTPEKIVYVSCNPATLARDLKILAKEYEIKEIQPIDNFPHSTHVETVALLTKK